MRSPLSRRRLLKAGAIVGGTVWVAPVIDSFVNRAAAGSLPTGAFPCSYAAIVFTIGTGTTLYVVTLNAPHPGCDLNNISDGSISGYSDTCNGDTYAVDAAGALRGPGFTVLSPPVGPPSGCSYFSINGGTVTATGATIQFVLIHDASFASCLPGGGVGSNGQYDAICGPISSFKVPTSCCQHGNGG